MYKEIENILVRTLSSYEYEKLEELKQTYTEEQIINAFKTSKIKNINYVIKTLQNKKVKPDWLDKEIINEPIDEKTDKDFNDFKDFINDFRGSWRKDE